jgi:DNA-binding GntR family transcriptional regulator
MARKSPVLPYDPVFRASIVDTVYEKMRDLILDGGLEPGRTITVQSLSAVFDVSAMPIRETLRRLVAERALTVVAGRSVGIPRLTIDKLDDLRRVRIQLESIAMAWAIRALTPKDFDDLAGHIDSMEFAITKGDRAGYVSANRRFHFVIYRASESPALLSAIESLWLQIGPFFSLLNESGNWQLANVQHRELREALIRKDLKNARAALRSDINGGLDVLKTMLAKSRSS